MGRRRRVGIESRQSPARGTESTFERQTRHDMPTKPTDIDQLYGLDPVFEPGEGAGSDSLEQFVDVDCPYCGEAIQIRLDLSAGSQSYVEDCQVCCQAILMNVSVADDGTLDGVVGGRIDQ
jgi:hypothetical protein